MSQIDADKPQKKDFKICVHLRNLWIIFFERDEYADRGL